MNEAVGGRGSGFRVLVIWGLKRMLNLCECGHMERNLGFSNPRILNGCLIVEKCLIYLECCLTYVTGHGGHGSALLFLRGLSCCFLFTDSLVQNLCWRSLWIFRIWWFGV